MGAYENPITVIDTESAKMWQQATTNIAQISINAMKSLQAKKTKQAKEDEAEITDRTAIGMKNQEAVIERITRAGVKSDAYFQYGMALMDDVTRLQGDLKYFSGTEEEKSVMMKDLAEKQKSISQLVSSGASIQDKLVDYRQRRGIGETDDPPNDQPGGMPLVGNDAIVRYHKIMGALSGLDEGGLESVYMKNGFLFGKIKGIEGEVNLTNETNFEPGEIIDAKKDIEEALNKSGLWSESKGWDKNYLNADSIRTEYYGKNNEYARTIVDYDYAKLDPKVASIVNTLGLAKINSESKNELEAFYAIKAGENAPKLNFVNAVGGTKQILDEESTKEWLKVWNNSTRQFIPDNEVIDDPNNFSEEIQYKLQIESDKSKFVPVSQKNNEDKPKQYQVRAEEDFNDFINSPVGFVEKYLQGGSDVCSSDLNL